MTSALQGDSIMMLCLNVSSNLDYLLQTFTTYIMINNQKFGMYAFTAFIISDVAAVNSNLLL